MATLTIGHLQPFAAQDAAPATSLHTTGNATKLRWTLNSKLLNAHEARDGMALGRTLTDGFTLLYPDDRVLRTADLVAAAAGKSRTIEAVS